VIRAKAPYEATFDAGTSVDVDGEVAGYEWDFGDGAAADGEQAALHHTYEEPGTYEASLTVVDDDGNRSDPRSFEVVVSDALAPVIEPHRTSGVAPLFVSFDATGTDGLAEGDFLNARFAWEFDAEDADPDGRYEHGEGFISGHVFEQPGSYRVKLTVTDVSGETAAAETEILVDAVDDSWTTYHFAADGDDANPGTIERPKRTPAHGLRELAGPKVRIRFRRGDAWKLDRSVEMTAHGPVIVDAYTDPDQPSDEPPVIEATWTDGAYFMLPISGRDWRLMDLAIRAGSNSYRNPREPGGAYLSGRDNMVAGVRFTKLGARVCPMRGHGNALYDCRASEAGAYFVFGSPHRFAIIGNDVEIESEHEEHVLRFQGGHKGYIAHNKLRAKKTKSNVQMRGATSQMVAYDNDLIGRTSNTSPENDASEEYVHHVLWEGNRFLYEPAYEDISRFGAAGTAVGVNARHIVIRNNLTVNYGRLFGTGGHVWVGPSVDVHVYNNSVYADDTAGKHRGRLGDVRNARLVTVRNNLLYNAVTARPDPWVRLFRASKRPAETLKADHNLLWAPAWDAGGGYFGIDGDGYSLDEWHELGFGRGTLIADPRLRSATPGSKGFMRLTPSSPAVDAGASVPVFIDFAGIPRGEFMDIGAFELSSGREGS
jgi:PKD repeat protein